MSIVSYFRFLLDPSGIFPAQISLAITISTWNLILLCILSLALRQAPVVQNSVAFAQYSLILSFLDFPFSEVHCHWIKNWPKYFFPTLIILCFRELIIPCDRTKETCISKQNNSGLLHLSHSFPHYSLREPETVMLPLPLLLLCIVTCRIWDAHSLC